MVSYKNHPFLAMLQTSVVFSAVTLGILMLARVSVLFFILGAENVLSSELTNLLITGFRFDIKIIATVLILFLCLPALVFAVYDRWYLFSCWYRIALLFIIVSILFLSSLNFGFYMYFGTPIDSLVFGVYEDGTFGVMSGVFSDWRLTQIIILCVASIVFFSYWFLKMTKKVDKELAYSSSRIKNLFFVFVITLLMITPARGGFDTFPLSRKTAAVSDDAITNSLIFNAPYHLYYTIRDRQEGGFRELSSQDLLAESGLETAEDLVAAAGFSQNATYKKTTTSKADDFQRPHVIVVLMESWSTHLAIMDTEDNNVLGDFAEHAKDDYFYPYFFSNAYGTNPAIDSLLMNSPITPLSQSTAANHSFSISNVLPFKSQGYDTLFLSGLSSAWRKHNNFWPRQGFDRYLGRATIETQLGVTSDNPRGVYEEYLFDYMKKMLGDAELSSKPLFSFVLTTNNHPPIRLPESYTPPEFDMRPFGLDNTDVEKRDILSAFHYQSDTLGKFLTWLKNSSLKNKVIVVAMGDHIYKGFVNYTGPDMAYLRYSTPTYFYVPKKYDQLSAVSNNIPGSHEDVFPTLYELSLSNSEYIGFGTPIMKKQPSQAYGWINQDSYIFDDGVAVGERFYPWKDDKKILLSKQFMDIESDKLNIIKEQKNQTQLKRYLIVKEFEESVN